MKRSRYRERTTFVLMILTSILSGIFVVIFTRQDYANQFLENLFQAKLEVQSAKVTDTFTYFWSTEAEEWTLRSSKKEVEGPKEVNDCIWPDCRKKEFKDRIINQLLMNQESNYLIKIRPPDKTYQIGQHLFLDDNCPVNKCLITHDSEEADVLIFQNTDVPDKENWVKNRRQNQIWVAYLLESPVNTFDRKFARKNRGKHEFNWTASYRSDSDIVTPYSKFVPFHHRIREYLSLKSIGSNNLALIKYDTLFREASTTHESILKSKTSSVVWFASNCNPANDRLKYAKELSKYIHLDIYGRCGNLTCHKWNQTGCLSMINTKYRFYLSFENSNCREYITEKLYQNAYGYNDLNHLIIPIVMGATRKDYEKFAPPASFIHVDDFNSTRELADYLKLVESDDKLYYSYFQWKLVGRFINTKSFCRICAMAHHSIITGSIKTYQNIQNWWMFYGDGEETSQTGLMNSCDKPDSFIRLKLKHSSIYS